MNRSELRKKYDINKLSVRDYSYPKCFCAIVSCERGTLTTLASWEKMEA